MLVKDCMTRHPIMIGPETAASEAQRIMAENNIRHLPVAGDGKRLLGLITRQRLALKPDVLGSLNVWEISRYIANVKAKQVMLKAAEVQTIQPDRTVERAARVMMKHKIGCLPVIEEDVVIGILSRVDLLDALQQMLGMPYEGVRVTMRMPNQRGEFAKLTSAIADQNWGVMGIGTFPSPRQEGYYDAVIKIPNITIEEANSVLSQIPGQELVDCRDVV